MQLKGYGEHIFSTETGFFTEILANGPVAWKRHFGSLRCDQRAGRNISQYFPQRQRVPFGEFSVCGDQTAHRTMVKRNNQL